MTSQLPRAAIEQAVVKRRLRCCSCGDEYEVVGAWWKPEDGLMYEVAELDGDRGHIPAFLTHELGEPHLVVDPTLGCIPCYEWVFR